uniref:Uncharacterized protein n=1 Tax=Lactuca sativa TaxID=4236 RepID=A0A9R1X8F9_LACSA|nr:hypothetical protein LSAT_V11C500234800 [Lactuca sativa]
MVLHKRMQKSVRWQETKIPPEIPSPLLSNIYRVFDFKKTYVVDTNPYGHAIAASRHLNIHELPDMVQIYYRVDVFQTSYQT